MVLFRKNQKQPHLPLGRPYIMVMAYGGIRAYKAPWAIIFKAKEHFERLHYSAEVMHIDIPYSVDQLINLSYQLLEMNQLEDAYIKYSFI